jgi:signal recognition particle subunit SRP54
MFDKLTNRFESVFKKLKGHAKLSEKNVEDSLKEVRIALLEADVHFKVVKNFIAGVKERAIGQEVLKSLTPGQQVIKIVNEELTKLMGGEHSDLNISGSVPVSVMLAGLQGSGKTTTAAKLAVFLRKQGKKPYLVPVDVYRPAAIDQLLKLGSQIEVPVFPSLSDMSPVDICKNARLDAQKKGCDILLLDTAGRLHIDQELMNELEDIKEALSPSDILLVADAMTGQDAVNIAKAFDEALDIGGVVLTKMDGDARGGAALSIKAVTGKPIKFIGIGEKINALEIFHPERISSRILNMGDILSFIEKAQESVDIENAKELQKKLIKAKFTLEDFREQLVQVRKMGSLKDIMNMMPGMNKNVKNFEIDDNEIIKVEAMISSMTAKERRNYKIINSSRKKRIAKGSGTSVQDLNKLLKNYAGFMKMFKKMSRKKGGMKRLMKGMLPF